MSEWISVDDRLPDEVKMRRYRVKTREGSMSPKTHERVMFGKLYATGFRFMEGDWIRVTHWMLEPPE